LQFIWHRQGVVRDFSPDLVQIFKVRLHFAQGDGPGGGILLLVQVQQAGKFGKTTFEVAGIAALFQFLIRPVGQLSLASAPACASQLRRFSHQRGDQIQTFQCPVPVAPLKGGFAPGEQVFATQVGGGDPKRIAGIVGEARPFDVLHLFSRAGGVSGANEFCQDGHLLSQNFLVESDDLGGRVRVSGIEAADALQNL
jgi:hypothetical protein